MSLTTISNTNTTSANAHHTARAEAATGTTGSSRTLGSVETAVGDGASATVSFSEKALNALEQIGKNAWTSIENGSSSVASAAHTALTDAEGLANEAWGAIKRGVADVEQFGEAVASDVTDGVEDAFSAAKTDATALGHYAGVAVDATGNVASDVASDTMMAASTVGGKALSQLL